MARKPNQSQRSRGAEPRREGRTPPVSTSPSEEALRDKEAFNFALFQYNPAPMTVVDREGRVIKSNLARRHCGQPLPALGEPLFRGPEDGYELDMIGALRRALEQGEAVHLPEQRHGDRFEEVTMAPFPGGAIVITHDVTARRKAEDEAREKQQQLIQAQKLAALGTLVSGVAHEISNPNHVMVLSAAALRRLVDQLLPILDRYDQDQGGFQVGRRPYREVRDEIPELVDTIRRAAERVQTLLNDLKAFARRDSADSMEPVRVPDVIRSAVSLLNPVIRKATRRFEMVIDAELPAVRGNAQRLEQVLINLLTNACQALKNPDQRIRLTARVAAGGTRVDIQVEDEGVGIAPRDLARITDPFFTTRQDEGGTGLGLSIARTIVEAHGGALTFSSALGKGTTATVSLPALREEQGGSA